MKFLSPISILLFCFNFSVSSYGQQNNTKQPDRCGTMQYLQKKLAADPNFKKQFEAETNRFNAAVQQRINGLSAVQKAQNGVGTTIVIPIVFHIVLTNQAQVSDAQIQAQLDTLNRDYAGTNGDSVRIPAWFKPLFGKSDIQFCLAKRTPTGEPTTGIERTVTDKSSFNASSGTVKHVTSGGADTWDPSSYYNVWVCQLDGNLLGYAPFPNMVNADEEGAEVDYRALPGSSLIGYNGGKTLTHETGHYFNLHHIWGDASTGCGDTDFVDDTPNQDSSTTNCSTDRKFDDCTNSGNGFMYQNYMDYTYDDCLTMFTPGQIVRMQMAFNQYRASFINSLGCQPPASANVDAQLLSVTQPTKRICNSNFVPVATIRNRGLQTLTKATITATIDNAAAGTTLFTGSLTPLATTTVTLSGISVTAGNHILKLYVSNPNGTTDQNTNNDTLTINFQYYNPVSTVSESFEGSIFPPAGWDIVNPDNDITWQKVTGVAKTGSSSVMINNLNYNSVGQLDYLRLPDANLTGVDSAFLSFQVAAATFTDVKTANNNWDTLEVLISTDCGNTYTSLYKKWGSNLVTRTAATTTSFVPTPAEWRKDSVNISKYIGAGKILLAFRNNTGFENNIYLDDINLRTVTINPNLKSRGFLVTPSPTTGLITVQVYPQPTVIKSIQVFNMSGQKVAETITNAQANYYQLNISQAAAGAYVVRIVMADKVLVKKIIKY